MKLVKFTYLEHIQHAKETFFYGIKSDNVINVIDNPFDTFPNIIKTGEQTNYNDSIQLLPFSHNPTIVCIGLNYHNEENHIENSERSPVIYKKPVSSILHPNGTIIAKKELGKIIAEGGLAIVIGKKTEKVFPEQIKDHILGYTCMNDITAKDIQKYDNQWTRSKSYNTFTPIGEHVETEVSNPNDLNISIRINDTVIETNNTKNLIHNINDIVSHVSLVFPLNPGDIVFTGGVSNTIPLKNGDIVTLSIEQIGDLSNDFLYID